MTAAEGYSRKDILVHRAREERREKCRRRHDAAMDIGSQQKKSQQRAFLRKHNTGLASPSGVSLEYENAMVKR